MSCSFKDPDLPAVQPLARQKSNWAVDQLPKWERNTPPQTYKDSPKNPRRYYLRGILFLISKNIYMKHKLMSKYYFTTFLPWFFGLYVSNSSAVLFFILFRRVSPFFLERSLSILQLNQD